METAPTTSPFPATSLWEKDVGKGKLVGKVEIYDMLPHRLGDISLSPVTVAEWQQLAQHYLQQPPDPRTATLALTCLQKALALEPTNLDLWLGLARAQHRLGQTAQADAACAEALKYHPHSRRAQWLRCMLQLPILYQTPDELTTSRARYAEQLERLVAACDLSDPAQLAEAADCVGHYKPFYLAYQDENDVDLQRCYGDFVCRVMAARYPAWATAPASLPTAGRALRIGFVSAHFNTHTVWDGILGGWLTQLDRRQFACYGYALSADQDDVTAMARSHCVRFVQGLATWQDWANAIRQDQLDVLIYPEVGEHLLATRLATLRLAPVQCTSWGHCVTSGLPTMDYFLSADLFEPPDGSNHYTEQLVRLPNLSTYFTAPPSPSSPPPRQDFGLRADVPLYLSLQSLFKYLPQYDHLYPQIAQQVGTCQFVFVKDNRAELLTRQFEQRLARAFAAYGLDWQQYVVLLRRLPPPAYHALQATADVYLDTIGWNGGTTTFNALAHHLPVVTMTGRLQRGRMGTALLQRAGVTATIATTPDDYVAIAVRLGQDHAWRQAIRAELANRTAQIFHDQAAVRGLEEFFKTVTGAT
jgi:predicted O-linked N-acetylglucosamine transferase (SPINDLY family)